MVLCCGGVVLWFGGVIFVCGGVVVWLCDGVAWGVK